MGFGIDDVFLQESLCFRWVQHGLGELTNSPSKGNDAKKSSVHRLALFRYALDSVEQRIVADVMIILSTMGLHELLLVLHSRMCPDVWSWRPSAEMDPTCWRPAERKHSLALRQLVRQSIHMDCRSSGQPSELSSLRCLAVLRELQPQQKNKHLEKLPERYQWDSMGLRKRLCISIHFVVPPAIRDPKVHAFLRC